MCLPHPPTILGAPRHRVLPRTGIGVTEDEVVSPEPVEANMVMSGMSRTPSSGIPAARY